MINFFCVIYSLYISIIFFFFWTSKVAQWVKALCMQAWWPDPQNSHKGGWRELTPKNYPLTSIYVLWHAHPYTVHAQ